MRRFIAVALMGVVGAGCSTVCKPGERSSCACAGGEKGTQVCESDGSKLSACECPQPAAASASGQTSAQRELMKQYVEAKEKEHEELSRDVQDADDKVKRLQREIEDEAAERDRQEKRERLQLEVDKANSDASATRDAMSRPPPKSSK